MAMDVYASGTYYRNEYRGGFDGTDEALEGLLLAAGLRLDGLTLNKITERGFGKLTAFQQDLVRRACCYEADYMAVNGIDSESGGVSGYTVLDMKVNMDTRTPPSAAQRENVSPTAYMLLLQSGLLWKAIG